MIALLKGHIIEREPKAVIVDVHGIGYRVTVLASLLTKLQPGEEVMFRIHHHVAEDAEALYGFTNAQDLLFFELLLTVPHVGPKTAINILDIAPPATLSQAVHEQDTTLLTKVAGIGRKTAERIIMELKGKMAALPRSHTGISQQEVVEALMSIGFTQPHAREVLQHLPKDVTSVEEAVRFALKEKVRS